MILLLYVFLLFLAIYFYSQKNRRWITLFIYIFFITDAFLINIFKTNIIKSEDFALVLVVLLSIWGFLSNRNFFSIKNDFIAKLFLVWMTFYLLEFCITVISNAETFGFALKVVRKEFLLLSYFVFRNYSYQSLIKTFKAVFVITFFVNILFVIQFFTSYPLLSSAMNFKGGIAGFPRIHLVPAFNIVFLLYAFITQYKFKLKIPFIFLSLLVQFMSMNRTPIFSLAIVLIIYFIVERDLKKIITIAVIGFLLFPVSSFFLEARTQGNSSSLEDIKSAFSMNSVNDYSNDLGTFSFRIAMLLERIDYLEKRPQYALLGVGCLHEDSPISQKAFNFQITPYKADESGNYVIRQNIDTADIMWTPVLLRYGIVGVILYIILIYSSITNFFKYRNESDVYMLAFLYLIFLLISSFSSLGIGNLVQMNMLIVFYLFYKRRIRINKKNRIAK